MEVITDSNGDLYLGAMGATRALTVKPTGNVGIGTTEPAEKLEVAGNIKGDAFQGGEAILEKTASGRYLTFRWSGTVGWPVDIDSSLNLAFDTNLLVLSTAGRVGIGTTEPSAKLTVAGDGTSAYSGISVTNTVGNASFIHMSNSGPALHINAGYLGWLPLILNEGGGNVGIGTTEPAEKLDVAGNIKSEGLNQIIFLRPLGSGADDRQQIQNAIDNLPDQGGIIYLMPHPTDPLNNPFCIGEDPNPPDPYHGKHCGLRLSRSGVKLRGYGGKLSDKDGVAEAVTKLKWIGSNPGIVVVMAPTVPNQWIGNLELSDLTIDGGQSGAATGLELNRVAASRFENLSVWNAIVGISMTTDATEGGVDTCFNHLENCLLKNVSQGLVLDGNGDADNPSDCTQNLFENLTIVFRGWTAGDAGILLKNCDTNVFNRVSIYQGQDQYGQKHGYGVVIEDPTAANANYFYHLAPDGGVRVNHADHGAHPDGKNVIFGYTLGPGQPPPMTNPSSVAPESVLTWINTRGVTHGFGKQTIFGRALFNAGGTVTVSAGSTTVTGSETATFLFDVEVDDKVTIQTSAGPETKRVVAISSHTELTVDSGFAGTTAAPVSMLVSPFLLRMKDWSGNTKVFVPDSGDVSLAGSLSAQGDINATGAADLASLEVGGTEVISEERLLHDVLMSHKYPECVPRPLVDILGDFPSVLDWGATGDGVTDDRPAFQSAIDNCAGNLLVPPGTYMLSDFLKVPSNRSIIGVGNPCLKLMPNRPFRTQLEPPTDPTFNAVLTNTNHTSGNHHIRLIGLKLDGNLGDPANPNQIVEQGGVAANLVVVLFNQVSFFEIADCELTGGVSECLYALGGCVSPNYGTTQGVVSNCHIHDSGQPDVDSLGVHGDRVDGMVVSGCTFQNIGLRAVGFSKGTSVSVWG
jgi:hypothetical protein